MKHTLLVGQHVNLRILEEDDVGSDYVSWMSDRSVCRYLTTPANIHDEESLKQYVRSMNLSSRDHLFGVFDEAGARHVGNIKIGNVDAVKNSADIGLIIGAKNCWGKGYATDAISVITEFAFETLSLHRLWAGMIAENIGSLNAFQRAGYKEVERRKKHTPFEGRLVDSIIVERLRS